MMLADLGAEVVKVEDPAKPDEARSVGPYFQRGESLYFAALNPGKRSIALSLSDPQAEPIIARLVRQSDVVIDNFKPGVTRRLGLDHERLTRINKRLVTCSITGYGETGPLTKAPAYDYSIQAAAGVMSMAGEPNGPPEKAGVSYVDHSGGLSAALAVCAGLIQVQRTGVGRHLEVALFDIQVSMLSYLASWQINAGYEPVRQANSAHPSLVPAQNFAVKDGWVSVFVGHDDMWRRLVAALHDPRLHDERFTSGEGRREHRVEIIDILSGLLATMSSAECAKLLSDHGVPCTRVATLSEALSHPQVRDRGLVRHVLHPSYGAYDYVGGPLPGASTGQVGPAPRLGEDTRNILTELGYSPREIDTLVVAGVAELAG